MTSVWSTTFCAGLNFFTARNLRGLIRLLRWHSALRRFERVAPPFEQGDPMRALERMGKHCATVGNDRH